MARKAKNVNASATAVAEPKERNRRTPEQQIADLEAKIASIQKRAATKAVKQSDEGRAFMVAVKALDKAIEVSSGETLRAVEAARAILAEHMITMGIRAPGSRPGRKARGEAA